MSKIIIAMMPNSCIEVYVDGELRHVDTASGLDEAEDIAAGAALGYADPEDMKEENDVVFEKRELTVDQELARLRARVDELLDANTRLVLERREASALAKARLLAVDEVTLGWRLETQHISNLEAAVVALGDRIVGLAGDDDREAPAAMATYRALRAKAGP